MLFGVGVLVILYIAYSAVYYLSVRLSGLITSVSAIVYSYFC